MVEKLCQKKEPLHPDINPNYKLVTPKCIMKAIYKKKPNKQKRKERIIKLGDDMVFDLDKIYNKYNNHISTKTFHFNKMMGRKKIESNLPFFMVNVHDRNSCLSFSEKSLKLNNFSDGDLKEDTSTFNRQKYFNWKINKICNSNINNDNISNIMKKIRGNKSEKVFRRKKKILIPGQEYLSLSLRKGYDKKMEFYGLNLDNIENDVKYINNKIDCITMKSFKNLKLGQNLLSDREKKIFDLYNVGK